MNSALGQCIEMELAERSPAEIACAYRALCCTMLLRTAMAARAKTPPRKIEVDQKRTAIAWTKEKMGVISFEDACFALDLSVNRARKAILGDASSPVEGAINRATIQISRNVARRRNNARPPDEPH